MNEKNSFPKMCVCISRGSEVDAEDHDWQTALIEASAKNNRGILQILLDHGAKINILDRFHKSPVYWAAENNAVDVLKVKTNYHKQNSRNVDVTRRNETYFFE